MILNPPKKGLRQYQIKKSGKGVHAGLKHTRKGKFRRNKKWNTD